MAIIKTNRIGEISYNKFGDRMEIIKYNKANNITIRFDNGYTVTTQYTPFIKGNIISPYDKTVCNVGYVGEGSYKRYSNIPGDRIEVSRQYTSWKSMLKRCYDIEFHKKYPTYKECIVATEWCNFQVFAKWYDENYYEIKEELMELDKDILIKGNKLYSPKTCIFVPKRINALFIKTNATRGACPIGVSWNKKFKKFKATCSDVNSKITELGHFDNTYDAFYIYKNYKEKTIKDVAELYKKYIPIKLYNALIQYQVEITD